MIKITYADANLSLNILSINANILKTVAERKMVSDLIVITLLLIISTIIL